MQQMSFIFMFRYNLMNFFSSDINFGFLRKVIILLKVMVLIRGVMEEK